MQYSNMMPGKFLSRPNRFVAKVEIDSQVHTVHVKNTGRCRELLTPGATVWCQKSSNPNRKTQFDLITVQKGDRLINMDSQAPNAIAAEYLPESGLFCEHTVFRREVTHGASRFDFAMDTSDRPTAYLEVKGCTLEREGIAYFPDAPTERGVKHVRELIALAKSGHPTYILFITQMKGVTALCPNDETHPAFGEALREAEAAGVHILAVDCVVKTAPNDDGTLRLSVTADQPIPVEL